MQAGNYFFTWMASSGRPSDCERVDNSFAKGLPDVTISNVANEFYAQFKSKELNRKALHIVAIRNDQVSKKAHVTQRRLPFTEQLSQTGFEN